MKVIVAQRSSDKSAANVLMRRVGERLHARYNLRTAPIDEGCDLLIQWGFKPTVALKSAIAQKIPYVIFDMGYWEGERDVRQSLSINGLHGTSMRTKSVLDLPPRYHPPIEQWQDEGEGCLIIGQLAGDAALRGENPETWMRKQAAKCVDTFGTKAQLRPHPRMLNPWEPPSEPLYDALDNTHICVTHSSTVGVAALRRGVLTIATHPGSPVYRMVGNYVNGMVVRMPGRQSFFHELSYQDYDLSNDEDCDAACDHIMKAWPCAKVDATLGNVEHPGARL